MRRKAITYVIYVHAYVYHAPCVCSQGSRSTRAELAATPDTAEGAAPSVTPKHVGMLVPNVGMLVPTGYQLLGYLGKAVLALYIS